METTHLLRWIVLCLSVALLTAPIVPQQTTTETSKVDSMITDFNRLLFVEMDVAKAFREHVFLEDSDTIDSEAGFAPLFPRVTKRISSNNKLKYGAMDFYFESAVPILQWGLGRMNISEETKFNADELLDLDNGELEKIWNAELKSLHFDPNFANLSEQTLDQHYEFSKNLTWAIRKKIDFQLIAKNLDYINRSQIVDKKVYRSRLFYTVRNKLFVYKVTIKKDSPKIMSINRAHN